MKDVQGIQRGKCNASGCECEEYRTSSGDGQSSSASGKFRCEYCDHTPVQHVKIIELGECRSCGKDNCEKYEFEDPNSYQNCAYCDCPANAHAGAEKLRKPTPQQQQQQQMQAFQGGAFSGGGMAAAPGGVGGFQPRIDAFGQPTQSTQFGTCKFPSCQFPKRIEGNKVHDFCSRTCAKKFSQLPPQMQGGGGQTVMVMGQGQPVQGGGGMMGRQQQQQQPMMTSAGPGGPTAAMPTSGYHHQLQTTGHGSGGSAPGMATTSFQSFTVMSKGQPVGTGTAMTLCKKCQKQPANPGHSWCQSCFINKS